MKFQSIAISFGLLTMVGCQNIFEDNDTTLDGSTPHNAIAAPSNNNVYSAGNAFKLESSFSDKDQVAEVDVKIVSLASDLRGNTNIINFKRFPKVIQYKLDTTLAPHTFSPGNYQMVIRSVDTRNNEGVQEIKFTVN